MPSRLADAFRSYRARRAYREAARALEAMDDHLLKDIGIARSQIWSAIKNSR
ncbi:DUF1127 domain-containing protein [Chelativorans sp. AA-79]|uniref:DUF1127 domain-containing protein n=1 Tax=Chelativorans sp. AA-79 TaxID=3028735 RepID=UPI0023F7DF4C|nr:DUF1127 domain-containing protein [Chelativorans sp. AA-79]WEX12009.1 DUF1127 domain-containing protein [Chelativorans sp. AA-79]